MSFVSVKLSFGRRIRISYDSAALLQVEAAQCPESLGGRGGYKNLGGPCVPMTSHASSGSPSSLKGARLESELKDVVCVGQKRHNSTQRIHMREAGLAHIKSGAHVCTFMF